MLIDLLYPGRDVKRRIFINMTSCRKLKTKLKIKKLCIVLLSMKLN